MGETKYELPVVAEVCSNCESEIELRWDVKTMGYKAYCPVCGKPIMLCDACMHSGEDGAYTDYCDWDRKTQSCFRLREEQLPEPKKKYTVWVTGMMNGVVHVEAANCADAKKQAEALYNKRRVEWYGEEFAVNSIEEE